MSSPQLFYAFTLGMLAAVNPCGFPLLPAYLELFVGAADSGRLVTRMIRAVTAGILATVGFVVVFGVFGSVIEAGWSTLAGRAISGARFVMVTIGIVMVLVGLASVLRRPLRLRLPVVPSGTGLRRPAGLVVFGVSYGVASLGCALPLFVSGVATTFTASSPIRGMAVFVSYAFGMGGVLSALAAAVAVAGPAAARPLRRFSRLVQPLGGVLLLLVGGYLAWYWIAAIASPTSSNPVERVVNGVQQHISSSIDAHPEIVGIATAALLVTGLISLAITDHRSSYRRERGSRAKTARLTDGDDLPAIATYSETSR